MSRSDLVDLAVILKRETEKAYCVDAGGRHDVWVPKSLCELERADRPGKTDTLTLSERLATEKGLI
jgi:hypothetical protein